MANFSSIKAGIKTILLADSDLGVSDGNTHVFDYEPALEQETGDPFAVVVASDNESEFETTSENKRTYGFIIRVHVERDSRGGSQAEQLLTDIVDRLVQAFDENYTLGVAGVLFTKATPSSWSYLMSTKVYRVADIKLSTMVSVDVTP